MTNRAFAAEGFLLAILMTAFSAYCIACGMQYLSLLSLAAACFSALCAASLVESSIYLWRA